MLDRKAVVTFAQNREDIFLAAILDGVENGRYVDIGANDPDIDSVTKFFYIRGWRGINVEPIARLYKKFQTKRKDDINLNMGVSDKEGQLVFREYTNLDGHSTFAEHSKQTLDIAATSKDYMVPVKTLETIFKEHTPQHVHFLKIDVEGLEDKVIKGGNWKKYRPEVVCIEADHEHKSWQDTFKKYGYQLVLFDGLNEYYLADEHMVRAKGLSERIVMYGHHALKDHQYVAWKDDSMERKRLEKENKILRKRVEELERHIAENRTTAAKFKNSTKQFIKAHKKPSKN